MSEQDSTRVAQETRKWIGDMLARLDMVEWDRFVVGEDYHGEKYINVYGWIDREKDAYKDFVLFRSWPDLGENGIVGFTTSSDRYTDEIYRRLFDQEPDDHNDCQRVEDTFNVPNAVELGPPTCRECGNELPFAFEDQESLVCMECVRGESNAQ